MRESRHRAQEMGVRLHRRCAIPIVPAMPHSGAETAPPALPPLFAQWFAARGWAPRDHQIALLAHAQAGRSVLLVAPTGGGKTLAGFLPSLVALSERPARRKPALHTLYISPLKALAVDVARNLETPVSEMGLAVRIETRTGDTPPARRLRQRHTPPDILLTTPEQFALLLSGRDALRLFATVRAVVLDEFMRLPIPSAAICSPWVSRGWSGWRRVIAGVGLSATVADPVPLQRFSRPPSPPGGERRWPRWSRGAPGATADHRPSTRRSTYVPWAGHLAAHAMADVMTAIRADKDRRLVFVNTRAQAERTFQQSVAPQRRQPRDRAHHGYLAPEQRRKVEAAMTKGHAAGGRLYVHPRSGNRLGRGRPRHLHGSTQRRCAAGAAYRPCQSPARRAFASPAGACQPVRSA